MDMGVIVPAKLSLSWYLTKKIDLSSFDHGISKITKIFQKNTQRYVSTTFSSPIKCQAT